MQKITSKDNDFIKHLKKLKDKKVLIGIGLFVVLVISIILIKNCFKSPNSYCFFLFILF